MRATRPGRNRPVTTTRTRFTGTFSAFGAFTPDRPRSSRRSGRPTSAGLWGGDTGGTTLEYLLAKNYTINGVPAGSYRVEFDPCGANFLPEYFNNKPDFDSADPVAVTAGQNDPHIDAQLAAAGSISGNVTGPSNQNLQNICVTAYVDEFDSVGFAQTNASGNYTIDGLPAGNYKVEFDPCAGGNFLLDAYATVSKDGGATFVNDFRINDAPMGSTVAAQQSAVRIQGRFQSAPWVEIHRVRVIVNGEQVIDLPLERVPAEDGSTPWKELNSGLRVPRDCWVCLVVLGEKPAVPRISDLGHIYSSSLGKLELDLMGSHQMSERQVLDAVIAEAIRIVFTEYVEEHGLAEIAEIFGKGVKIEVGDMLPSAHYAERMKRVPPAWDKAFEVNASGDPAVSSTTSYSPSVPTRPPVMARTQARAVPTSQARAWRSRGRSPGSGRRGPGLRRRSRSRSSA